MGRIILALAISGSCPEHQRNIYYPLKNFILSLVTSQKGRQCYEDYTHLRDEEINARKVEQLIQDPPDSAWWRHGESPALVLLTY